MTEFAPDVVTAVLAHMNDDHRDDSLLIVRAFAEPGATAAVMTGLDGQAGVWEATVPDTAGSRATRAPSAITVRIPWPIPVTERPDIRHAVVALHTEARSRLEA